MPISGIIVPHRVTDFSITEGLPGQCLSQCRRRLGFQTRALARECVGGPGRRSTNRADARGSSPVRPLAPRHPPARAFRSRRGEIRRRRCPRTPRARSAMTGEPPSGSDPDPDVVCISDGSDVEPVALASDSEDLVCAKCGEGDDECNLVLCDECPQGFHVYCLRPKLPSVPRGAWRCPDCAEARARSVAHPNVGEHLVDADPGDSSDERRAGAEALADAPDETRKRHRRPRRRPRRRRRRRRRSPRGGDETSACVRAHQRSWRDGRVTLV